MFAHSILLIIITLGLILYSNQNLANYNKTTSIGISKFYFSDELFYFITKTNPLFQNITINNTSQGITINSSDTCKVDLDSFELGDNIFSFNLNCKEKNTMKYNFTSKNVTFTYNSKNYTYNYTEAFSYQIFTMQLFLESSKGIFSVIKFIVLFSGLYVSFYGYCHIFAVSTLFIQYFLFILVEEIYEIWFRTTIVEEETIGMFLFIFSLIIGGAFGILFNLKLPKSLPFIYTFSAVFCLSKILIYLLPYHSLAKIYFYYLFGSIVLAAMISSAILYSSPGIKKNSFLFTSSIIGPYLVICGLSYIAGGIIYIKIRNNFNDGELQSDNKNEYLIIYISLFIISVLFQFFQKSFEISKSKLEEEKEEFKKMNSNDTSNSINIAKPRLSTEMENTFRPSDVGKMLPEDNPQNLPEPNPEEPFNDDEGYVNEENLE